MNIAEMVNQILQKAGIVSYRRLLRVVNDGLILAKHKEIEWNNPELQKFILSKANVVIAGDTHRNPILIAKSDIFERIQKPEQLFLRDFIVSKLHEGRGTINVKSLRQFLDYDFKEINFILEHICQSSDTENYTYKLFDEDFVDSGPTVFTGECLEKISQSWIELKERSS